VCIAAIRGKCGRVALGPHFPSVCLPFPLCHSLSLPFTPPKIADTVIVIVLLDQAGDSGGGMLAASNEE
jgi:hypothetical protein